MISERAHEAFRKGARDQIHHELSRRRAEDHQGMLQRLQHLESVVGQRHKALLCALEQLERGEQPAFPAQPAAGPRPADPFGGLAHALDQAQAEVLDAVAALASRLQRAAAAEAGQAEVFVYIAQRLHALVSRTLAALDQVEKGVEDPDLLHALFTIDHLVTQTRRAVESLAVLGGETPRRVITPLLLTTVLRQAVAEIEQYPRVRVPLPRQEVALPGHAGPDIIHLLAELVENGTKFSPPTTQVLMRATPVPSGLAIEIEDRGLHMSTEKLALLNALLAAPDRVGPREQLKNKQIGLLVAARLAQRHGIRVELRPSIVGGTQALVVVPSTLLVDPALARAKQPTETSSPVPGSRTTAAGPSVSRQTRFGAAETRELPPDAASPRPATASLPQRRKHVPPPTQASAAETASAPAPEPLPDGRPALPRRSEAQVPAGPTSDPHGVPSGPARPGLMASYRAGVRRAADAAAEGESTG